METFTSTTQGSSSKPSQEGIRLPKWNPKHKIFLSHSGKEKEFVRQLCKDLEVETHQPFFDERSSSLMKGEHFAPQIFEATRQCLVAVVVLSEDFLTSKWPMLELVEFVKAKKSHNPMLKLFPLFYKLSPEDLKTECIENRWKSTWGDIISVASSEVMPLDDTRSHLSMSLCTDAFGELRRCNGLRLQQFASEVAYREAIVKEISLLVAPYLLDDTSDVVGNERLCKVLARMFVEDTVEDSNLRGTRKLGLYGMGGMGKTTMSRALCMFFYRSFNGRVFHVELGLRPPLDLQKLVLVKLLRINKDVVERVHTVHEGRRLLKEYMSRQPVFLVVDNIIDGHESSTEALAYLGAGFHVGSMIMITSRSFDVVEDLFPHHPNAQYCHAMASLNVEEARLIFFQRAVPHRKMDTLTLEEQKVLGECASQCLFWFDNQRRQYHPLALHALADYYHKHDNTNVLTWKQHLGDLNKLKLSNASSDIFGILGLQFRTLSLREKLIFLDLSLYVDCTEFIRRDSRQVLMWLEDIHEDTSIALKIQLQGLKRSGIITLNLKNSENQFITVHDLYLDFAKWYLTDGEGAHCAELGCVYHRVSTSGLPRFLKGSNPLAHQLQRIRLENLKCATFPSKKVQEWCNVVVLQIHECSNLRALNLHGLSCLCHLELKALPQLEGVHFTESPMDTNDDPSGTLESLQHVVLEDLTSLKWIPDFNLCTLLKSFAMFNCDHSLLKPPSFQGCSQLKDLYMDWNTNWLMEDFKLNALTSLTTLRLFSQPSSQSLTSDLSQVGDHERLSEVQFVGLEACYQLQVLSLWHIPISSLQGLEKLTKLRQLTVFSNKFMKAIPDLSALVELEDLYLYSMRISRLSGVERLHQLRHLRCYYCHELTELPNLDHLQKLTAVDFGGCESLKVMPKVPVLCRTESGVHNINIQ